MPQAATARANRAKTSKPGFTAPFVAALVLGIAAAVALSPFAAELVAAAGFRFPFPRIFDRTVMLTLAAALLLLARRLELLDRLRAGFAAPRRNLRALCRGVGVSVAAMVLLLIVAAVTSVHFRIRLSYGAAALAYIPAALVIGVLEEAFFRAFLLAGLESDFGTSVALIGSSAFYAIVHVVRSPERFYLTGFHPTAGLNDLVAGADRLGHAAALLPTLVGLFLLGLVLGEAFILTRRAWCSTGLHAGFVLGAKTWRIAADGTAAFPHWLAGPGPVPLIAAPAAWVIAVILLIALPLSLKPAETG